MSIRDCPYTALPRTVLAVQRYRADDPPPYDDTGWSLDRLRGVVAYTVSDSGVLARPMRPLAADARAGGAVAGAGATLAVAPMGDWRSAVLPWRLRGARVTAADTAFAAGGATYPAGTLVTANTPTARAAVGALGLRAAALGAAPGVRGHAVALPRVLFLHTWLETQSGGLLVTEGNTARAAVELGFNPTVSVAATPRLVARGAVYRAAPVEKSHPALYGYEAGPVAVYVNQAPVPAVQADENAAADARTRAVMQNVADSALLRETARQRARVVLRFEPNADSLLVSGQLENGAELAGKAAVVDAPSGRGHVLLFGIRPMWRYETQGSYAMVLNAMAHWNALDAGAGRAGGGR